MEDREVRQLVSQAETLLDKVQTITDPEAQSIAFETIRVLFDLYGEGLARMVEVSARRGGQALMNEYQEDELISHLLLMHGLHPVTLEDRVLQALAEVRPYMESHGGNVEFLGVADGVAHLRLVGSCHGCGASASTMKLAVEKAIQKYAPDVVAVEAEGAVETPANLPAGFIPLTFVTTAEGWQHSD
jgi:Fe-S cluster biogenesis protein NfuA